MTPTATSPEIKATEYLNGWDKEQILRRLIAHRKTLPHPPAKQNPVVEGIPARIQPYVVGVLHWVKIHLPGNTENIEPKALPDDMRKEMIQRLKSFSPAGLSGLLNDYHERRLRGLPAGGGALGGTILSLVFMTHPPIGALLGLLAGGIAAWRAHDITALYAGDYIKELTELATEEQKVAPVPMPVPAGIPAGS